MARHKPFKNLKSLLKDLKKSKPSKLKVSSPDSSTNPLPEALIEEKDIIFSKAMKDVTPMLNNKIPTPPGIDRRPTPFAKSSNDIEPLHRLILEGEGFTISNIPEYMEGTGYNTHPEITKRLHRGEFSIQDHLDLHGMNRFKAKDCFDSFLQNAITSGKRVVLIIHGRGLSSPVKPILKGKVIEWLTSGLWRKWVIAFSSARAVDGGAGATYVLLRKNPATKRCRKGKKFRYHQEF